LSPRRAHGGNTGLRNTTAPHPSPTPISQHVESLWLFRFPLFSLSSLPCPLWGRHANVSCWPLGSGASQRKRRERRDNGEEEARGHTEEREARVVSVCVSVGALVCLSLCPVSDSSPLCLCVPVAVAAILSRSTVPRP
jgi:hypothetical protein